MALISSVGRGIPKYPVTQEEIKQLVSKLIINKNKRLNRYLPVFDHAKVTYRQLACPLSWYEEQHTFSEANASYIKHAIDLSLEAIDRCLEKTLIKNKQLVNLAYEAIDFIIFVSSTGIATPSIDAHLINARPFREDVIRMPLFGLGCAGGAMGLARAYDYLQANKEKVGLVVCCELCSLTFQLHDQSTSNIVGTALFGDGVAATLLIGEESEHRNHLPENVLSIKKTHSLMKKETTDVMGWRMGEYGLHVIFSRRIPTLIESIWHGHLQSFLKEAGLTMEDIHTFIAHPGGRKVLEEMERVCHIPIKKLLYSYDVLENHGNMSSATVMYVLKQWLEADNINYIQQPFGVLSALGPGFSSELLLLRWGKR